MLQVLSTIYGQTLKTSILPVLPQTNTLNKTTNPDLFILTDYQPQANPFMTETSGITYGQEIIILVAQTGITI